MIPFYIFYSMFGFQRTGDQFWQFADQLGRGFVLGATAGRTTLTGEGLQHADGHSLLLASTNPAAVAYDPAFAFEIAHIVRDGLRRMYAGGPNGTRRGHLLLPHHLQRAHRAAGRAGERRCRGHSPRHAPVLPRARRRGRPRAQVLASGVAMPWALRAQRLLGEEWGVDADVWSVTSWNELRRDAVDLRRGQPARSVGHPRVPYVAARLADASGPVVAVSDFMRAVPDQISRWVPTDYSSLGTDGFGFADTRGAARRFFHVDAESIVLAVLTALAKRGEVKPEAPREAIDRYKLLDVTAAGVGTVGGDA